MFFSVFGFFFPLHPLSYFFIHYLSSFCSAILSHQYLSLVIFFFFNLILFSSIFEYTKPPTTTLHSFSNHPVHPALLSSISQSSSTWSSSTHPYLSVPLPSLTCSSCNSLLTMSLTPCTCYLSFVI